ncbi:MAG: ComF family protein [Lachnospiraceae bacterium]|nr:ComF family protein [Lachnospiraceae bacterium]
MKNKNYKKILEKAKEQFALMLFPARCPVCDELLAPEERIENNKEDTTKKRTISFARKPKGIHLNCDTKLHYVISPVCMHCGRPIENDVWEYCYDCQRKRSKIGRQNRKAVFQNIQPSKGGTWGNSFDQGKAIFLYKGALKKTLYRFKYSNKREYAQFFATEAQRIYGDWIASKEIDCIMPVPMYLKKMNLRGYNQAESFAKALSKLTQIPMEKNLVQRIKDTAPQKMLNDIERKNNLKNAFQKTKSIVQYRHILVVDDIYTTGSTADAVAEELKNAGAEEVYFLSIGIGKGM